LKLIGLEGDRHTGKPSVLLWFFGKYPASIRLLPECHGSVIIFDWCRKFKEAEERKETMDGLNQTSWDIVYSNWKRF